MNISNVQFVNPVTFIPKPQGENQDSLPPSDSVTLGVQKKSDPIEIKLPGQSMKDSSSDSKKSWEELVMKPSPISLEERMSQVISAEQVRDLLSLITRMPMKDKEESHRLDVKR